MPLSYHSPLKRSRGRPRRDEGPEPDVILKAALIAFARHGFDGTSLRMISDEAGVDSSLIVRRYDGKFGLWRAVVDHVSEAFSTIHPADAPDDQPVSARLRTAIGRFVSFNLDFPDLGRFFIDEIARPGQRRDYIIDRILQVHRDAMLPILRQAEQEHLLPPGGDPETLLAMLIGAVAMPLMMRSVTLPGIGTEAGRAAFVGNVMALFCPASLPERA